MLWVSFWSNYSVPLINFLFFMSVPFYHDCCNHFTVVLKLGSVWPHVFSMLFWLFRSFTFSCDFGISLSLSPEILLGFCFLDYTKAFECVDHNKLWKILKEMGVPDHPTCLLRNLYEEQGATVYSWTWNMD